jgi:bla regulator protein BlaR1
LQYISAFFVAGLLLAAVTGFIIIFTRKANAATRYNLLIAALVLFAVGVALLL